MTEYKKQISRDEYLQALALFTIAHEHYCKACMFGEALNKIIMNEPTRFTGSHIDDAIYDDGKKTSLNFDTALRLEGINVVEA